MFSSWLNRIAPEYMPHLLLLLPPIAHDLVQEYVWREPKHIVSLFFCYVIAFITDLILLSRSERLTPPLTGRTAGRYLFNTVGTLAFLMVGTAGGTLTPWLFWLPDLFISIVFIAVATICTRNLSKLGVIQRKYHTLLEDTVEAKIKDRITQESQKEQDEIPH